MDINLIYPQGVVASRGLVITEPELGILYYNGNYDIVFQRENEFHLATTSQLIRLLNDIQRNSSEAEEMYKKLELTIEARNDVNQARKIIRNNLDGGGILSEQPRDIQVKDIVKEVEDYLKTYSSAEMDIRWCGCSLDFRAEHHIENTMYTSNRQPSSGYIFASTVIVNNTSSTVVGSPGSSGQRVSS
ncbi:hypothetical protein Tco_0472119 [Tanacetum coccineum]